MRVLNLVRRHRHLFLSLGAVSTVQSTQCENTSTSAYWEEQRESESVQTEPYTHTKFPLTIEGLDSSSSLHWLVDKNVRCMMGLCFLDMARAYSYALYLSDTALSSPAKDISSEDSTKAWLFPTPSTQPLDYPSCLLRLVMQHSAASSHISNGFRTSLNRVLAKVDMTDNDRDQMKRFLEFVEDAQNVSKGDMLEILRLPGGFLQIRLRHRTLSLQSEALSWGLFKLLPLSVRDKVETLS